MIKVVQKTHPPKRHAKDLTLADVTLPPPTTPVPLQEGVDWTFPRAESPFEILTTGYSVPFGMLRLRTPTYNVEEILAQYPGSRAFDLILWPAPFHRLYNLPLYHLQSPY